MRSNCLTKPAAAHNFRNLHGEDKGEVKTRFSPLPPSHAWPHSIRLSPWTPGQVLCWEQGACLPVLPITSTAGRALPIAQKAPIQQKGFV